MTIYDLLTGLLSGVLAVASLVLLLARDPRRIRIRARLERFLSRTTGRADLTWLSWWHVTAVVVGGLAVVMGYDLVTGLFGCAGPGSVSDIGGFLAQGQALWTGGDPFNVPDCGGTIAEPDGLASVLINGVGSWGGVAGIAVVWGLIAGALVPLTWWAAGPDRRYLTLVVATSPLFFPLVAGQIDGASNALVPATVLLTLILATRSEVRATGLAGFLATQRFPTLFPVLAMSGSFRRRFAAALAVVGVFALGTGISYLVWGREFLGPVFLEQIGRRSFSLNLWGIFLLNHGLPSGYGLAIGQAIVSLGLIAVVFAVVRSPLRAAAITLTGIALLSQFLSFNILVWLLPVALVGARPRWWLWGIAVVGSLNYSYALSVVAWRQGILWPSELLDVVLTALLLGLFVELWRSKDPKPAGGAEPLLRPSEQGRGRIMSPTEVPRDDAGPSRALVVASPPHRPTDHGVRSTAPSEGLSPNWARTAMDSVPPTDGSRPELSIVLAALNERDNLPELLARIYQQPLPPLEVIVVDDGSTDGTREYLSEFREHEPTLHTIFHDGKQTTLRAQCQGIEGARGDFVVVMDADLQHPPERIPEMLRELENGAGVVVASRYRSGGSPGARTTFRAAISRGAEAIAKIALRPARNVTDPVSGFFGFRREIVLGLGAGHRGYKLLLFVLVMNRTRPFAEVGFHFEPRTRGVSKVTQTFEFVRLFLAEILLAKRLERTIRARPAAVTRLPVPGARAPTPGRR
ncbi:MAG: glycosyltransferase [Thermoplasmata archaeon]|nr:glycosyltransferase [Thermoplasmata archaeon]